MSKLEQALMIQPDNQEDQKPKAFEKYVQLVHKVRELQLARLNGSISQEQSEQLDHIALLLSNLIGISIVSFISIISSGFQANFTAKGIQYSRRNFSKREISANVVLNDQEKQNAA